MANENNADSMLDAYLGITDDTREAEQEDREELDGEVQAADEDPEQAEDAEGEGDENADDAPADADAAVVAYADKSHKVKLEDGTETTVGELLRGNLREGDYSRKTQELAAQRKELESRNENMRQNEQVLDLAIEVSLASIPPEPDLALLQSDPVRFMQQKAFHEARMKELEQLYSTKQGLVEAQKQEQTRAFAQHLNHEAQRAAELMPELRTPEGQETFNSDLVKAAKKYGFAEDEVGIFDHRFMLMAKDVIEYQKILANKPAALEKTKGKPPLTPSKRQSGNANNGNALEKFKKSGGKDMNALDQLLDKFI